MMLEEYDEEEDEELNAIRRRKLQQLAMQQQQQAAMAEEAARLEAQKQQILRQILTPDARERLGRVKVARPDIVTAVENQLIMLAQSGRLNAPIDDNMLRQILAKLIPEKREIRIERR